MREQSGREQSGSRERSKSGASRCGCRINRVVVGSVMGIGLCPDTLGAPGDELWRALPEVGYDALQFGSAVDLNGPLALVIGEGIFTTPTPGGAFIVYAETGDQLALLPQPVRPEGGAPIDAWFYGGAISGPMDLSAVKPGAGAARVAVVGTAEIAPCACYRPLVRGFELSDPASPTLLWSVRPDGFEFDDAFGDAIAIDGGLMLVGASGDDDNGPLSGAAYLFDVATGTQLGKLLADDGEGLDQFGYSVDLDGSLAIVGARWESEVANRAGAAYVFDITDPANPVQVAKLVAPDGGELDYMGWDVAILDAEGLSPALAVVGSIFDDDLGLDSGAAYVFGLADPASPVLHGKMLAPDGGATDDFGWGVALERTGDGVVGVITARTDDEGGPGVGSAYIYDFADPASPSLVEKVLPSVVTSNDVFGWSVALDGGRAIVGAPGADDQGNSSGAAYLIDATFGPSACNPADLSEPFGTLDLADISVFVGAFTTQQPPADLNNDGVFDLADISGFVGSFSDGCP